MGCCSTKPTGQLENNKSGGPLQPEPKPAAPEEDPNIKSVKLVMIGDTTVGKSCLVYNYLYQKFSDDYEPNVLDVYHGKKDFMGKTIQLEIHDVTGDQMLGVNRKISFNNAGCFLFCAAFNNKTSL